MIKIVYENKDLILCEKPVGILSQMDASGADNMVAQLEVCMKEKGVKAEIGVVHRLDKIVGGLMVFSKNSFTAAKLSQQIQNRDFEKEYFAVVHGVPEMNEGVFEDLLFKDSSKNKTYVVKRMRKGVKKASLEYKVIDTIENQGEMISLVHIKLHTGRTHQIRVQFSSRKMPLLGDSKYGSHDHQCDIALWSYRLRFQNPRDHQVLDFTINPPESYPWNLFVNRFSDDKKTI